MDTVVFENTGLPDIVELRGITQRYGSKTVIQDLNLLIENKPGQGQFFTILGASGCGKSTLLRFIAGIQNPTEGQVLLYEKPLTHDNQVGMVFQQYSSFPWLTVLENVALPLKFKGVPQKEREEKATQMLETCGLLDHRNKFAKYPILSGGQLQRVAIARSLIANPHILLMDEPFGALDINTRLSMQDMLLRIWEKYQPTILFVTHDIQEAVYLSDEVIIMRANPGQIVFRVQIDLPKFRDRGTKRQNQFLEHVYDLEDKMLLVHERSNKKAE